MKRGRALLVVLLASTWIVGILYVTARVAEAQAPKPLPRVIVHAPSFDLGVMNAVAAMGELWDLSKVAPSMDGERMMQTVLLNARMRGNRQGLEFVEVAPTNAPIGR